MRVLIFLALLAAPAVSAEWCVTAWWDRVCEDNSDDSAECLPGSEFYSTKAACMSGFESDTAGGYCVTDWSPKTCGLIDNNECIAYEYPEGGWSSESECESSDIWCVSQWWPVTCTTNMNNCETGSPLYYSEDLCESPGQTPTPSIDYDLWCVTQWHPTVCAQVGDGPNDCLSGTSYYNTRSACDGLTTDSPWCVSSWSTRSCTQNLAACVTDSPYYENEFLCENPGYASTPDPSDYCLTAYYPRECGTIGSSNCVSYEDTFSSYNNCVHDTPTPSPGEWCVTDWWNGNAVVCTQISSLSNGLSDCLSDENYDSEVTCEGGDDSIDPNDWCVINWASGECGVVSSSTCVLGTTYHDSQQDCESLPTEVPYYCVEEWASRTCIQTSDPDDCATGSSFYSNLSECTGDSD